METTESRTHEQLVLEIEDLRRRIRELETRGIKRAPAHEEALADIEQRALAALGQSERRFKDLVESLNAIVWESDAITFHFRFVSEQAEIILGYPVAEWLTEPDFWRNHIHPEDREAAVSYCLRCTRALANHEFEYRMIAKDGRVVWVRDLVTIESAGDVPVLLRGVMFDITRHKQLEAQLLQTQKMESVGRLAGGIAHDFNNLLTAIMGHADLGALKLPTESKAREHIKEIQQAAVRAQELTRQLLTFARQRIADPRTLDVNGIVAGTSKLLRRLIGEHIDLTLELSPRPAVVIADTIQIEQVLVNLAVNARDAMPNGGKLTISVSEVTWSLDEGPQQSEPATYVKLVVSDTGTGLSSEAKNHLFEPFFTTKEIGKGTGLGLATCYGIVAQNGGRIEIESEQGHGTQVIIHLPLVEGAPEATPQQEEDSTLPGGTETVLLVEDEPQVRELTARILRDLGYTVLEAANGHDALSMANALEGGHIDLLLTDVVMPSMGGEALATELHKTYPNARVLFISGYAASPTLQTGLLSSGSFLEKPSSAAALARKVREVLEDR